MALIKGTSFQRTWFKLLCLSMIFVSCTKNAENPKLYQIKELPSDFRIPKIIFENIQEKASSESKTSLPVFVFLPIQVKLTGLQSGVVQDDVVQIQFPNGGGNLDLAKFLRKQGSFKFEIVHPTSPQDLELFDVVFVSNMQSREIDDELQGVGCGRAIRLTAQYEKMSHKSIIKVNTTDARHLHVIGGQFVLVYKRTNQYYLTHVNVFDSRNTSLQCQSLSQDKT